MKRKIALTAAGLAASFGLIGCGADTGTFDTEDDSTVENPANIKEQQITLRDGRIITCVTYNQYRGGGIDCDWFSSATSSGLQ